VDLRQGRDGRKTMMFLAPWLICALLAWFMWWLWDRQKRR
jgi:hypothetical protein